MYANFENGFMSSIETNSFVRCDKFKHKKRLIPYLFILTDDIRKSLPVYRRIISFLSQFQSEYRSLFSLRWKILRIDLNRMIPSTNMEAVGEPWIRYNFLPSSSLELTMQQDHNQERRLLQTPSINPLSTLPSLLLIYLSTDNLSRCLITFITQCYHIAEGRHSIRPWKEGGFVSMDELVPVGIC